MVRLGREIEDRTVVSITSVASIIAGNLLAGLTKNRLTNRSLPRQGWSRIWPKKVPVNRAEFYFVSPLLRIHSPPLEQ